MLFTSIVELLLNAECSEDIVSSFTEEVESAPDTLLEANLFFRTLLEDNDMVDSSAHGWLVSDTTDEEEWLTYFESDVVEVIAEIEL